MNKKVVLIIALLVAAFIAGIYFLSSNGAVNSSKLDGFAQCLKDKGLVFYGAFWCPHCQSQKKLFGASEKLLPYIECSTADGQGQLDVCKEKGIESYPTWVFPDGSKQTGELSLEELSQKSSCQLP